jgi:hypothetical protein
VMARAHPVPEIEPDLDALGELVLDVRQHPSAS